ncbi:hypothetical protein QFZ56_006079 [Streptomyces achromogenes]|uniref:Uncharacterized protein n=1 Tax=Streptomyces achromogenes TaxID=67255 RepID=A0ABU0QAC2_STRAH|nr:hypothetical protein [Streptomyces achromogenes]
MSHIEGMLADGVGGDPAKTPIEEPVEVRLPLGHQVGGRDDQRLADESIPLHLTEIEPGHDRLTSARLVGEHETQPRLRQHGPVNRVRLMRIRVQG